MLTIVAILISSFSFIAFAQERDTVYSFEMSESQYFYYYKDNNGEPYIVENGIKYNIAVPEYVAKVTDETLLAQLRKDVTEKKIVTAAKSKVLFSQNVYFNTLAKTGILNVTDNYLFLKCSNLNPSNAQRGFSYWILYSLDGREWTRAFYVNKSLTFYTRHPMATLGNAPYIEIHIFSYYGTVSSCLLSVKQGCIRLKFLKNKKVKIALISILLAINLFLLVFFYYCPAHYAKTVNGDVALVNGQPVIYHTDIFGNTFIFDNGLRVYVAVPDYYVLD